MSELSLQFIDLLTLYVYDSPRQAYLILALHRNAYRCDTLIIIRIHFHWYLLSDQLNHQLIWSAYWATYLIGLFINSFDRHIYQLIWSTYMICIFIHLYDLHIYPFIWSAYLSIYMIYIFIHLYDLHIYPFIWSACLSTYLTDIISRSLFS